MESSPYAAMRAATGAAEVARDKGNHSHNTSKSDARRQWTQNSWTRRQAAIRALARFGFRIERIEEVTANST